MRFYSKKEFSFYQNNFCLDCLTALNFRKTTKFTISDKTETKALFLTQNQICIRHSHIDDLLR